MFKPTKQYFKRNIMPFGGFQPGNFMGIFPSINPYILSDGNSKVSNLLNSAVSLKDLFLDIPVNYLMSNVQLPELVMHQAVIHRNGRAVTIPTGVQTPLRWSATFLLDEDFYALRYFTFWLHFLGGFGNEIIYNEQITKEIFTDSFLKLVGIAKEIENTLPTDYQIENLHDDVKNFGKTDITVLALPKTFANFVEIDIPFVRPLNLATPFLGRSFILKNTTVSKIGSLVMDTNNQNSIGSFTVEFLSDYMEEKVGTSLIDAPQNKLTQTFKDTNSFINY